MLRKSGIRQTSQSSATEAPSLARAATSASCTKVLSAAKSQLSRTRVSHSLLVCCSSAEISALVEPNCSLALRQYSLVKGANRFSVMASTNSSCKGAASPVTPKLPLFICRPARPAICASSVGKSGRMRLPSNFDVAEKATWFTSKLSPMPMASVATR